MKIRLPKITIMNLFLFVIIAPTTMVFITIVTMHHDAREYKVTHEVYFELELDGQPLGILVFGLFGDAVPRTVKNFITFATKGYNGYKYEGTTFHRVIKKFMIQGGDVVSGDGQGSISIYGNTFLDENFDIKHARPGFLSMANKGKDTNGCQFFITTIATPWLNDHHVVFGKVIEGEPFIHVIDHMSTDWDDKPLKDVTIVKSGRRTVKDAFYITDDPYNLYDWVKTISVPLGISFCIMYIFNHLMGKLDDHIYDGDGAFTLDEEEDIKKKEKTGDKKALLEDEPKQIEDQKGEQGDKQAEKKEGDTEVRKRLGIANAKKDD